MQTINTQQFAEMAAGLGSKKQIDLLIAFDATASRQNMWETAKKVQSELFQTATETAHITAKIGYFRGHEECRISKAHNNADQIVNLMNSVKCQAGGTQLGKLLKHSQTSKQDAVIYTGDTIDPVEDFEHLKNLASEQPAPWYIIHDQSNHPGKEAFSNFQQLAKLTGGAAMSYGKESAERETSLKETFAAIAALSTGGLKALSAQKTEPALRLLASL